MRRYWLWAVAGLIVLLPAAVFARAALNRPLVEWKASRFFASSSAVLSEAANEVLAKGFRRVWVSASGELAVDCGAPKGSACPEPSEKLRIPFEKVDVGTITSSGQDVFFALYAGFQSSMGIARIPEEPMFLEGEAFTYKPLKGQWYFYRHSF